MRPLLVKDLPTFLQRFNNFEDGEFRHLEVLSPTDFKIIIATQDTSRDFDWITIDFELSGTTSANLLDNSKLSLIDMSDGINISHNGTNFAIEILNSTFYIECTTIKYQEGAF